MDESTPTFAAPDRETWRTWLQEHHATSTGVWLVLHKKGVPEPSVTYEEAVEEALRFGWIDSQQRHIDGRRHKLRFSPRKPDSVWADSNKARVERLTAAGLMTEAGMAAVRAAKERGTWEAGSNRRLDETPLDLEEALAALPAAAERWRTWTQSYRRQYVYWVLEAKKPETRSRRIADVVARAAAGLRPGERP